MSFALGSDKIDFFVPGWIENPDWNSVMDWNSFSQPEYRPENKLISSSFWHFESAYSISLSSLSQFTNFSRSECKLTEAPRLVDFCGHLNQPRTIKSILSETVIDFVHEINTVFAKLVAMGHYIFKPFLKSKPITFSCTPPPPPFEKEPFWGATISVGAN